MLGVVNKSTEKGIIRVEVVINKYKGYHLGKWFGGWECCIDLRQSFTVFYISIATVRGPTPPGTGVASEHFSFASAEISPQRWPFSSRLIPISIATESGLSCVMRLGFPTAEMTISASLVSEFRSLV